MRYTKSTSTAVSRIAPLLVGLTVTARDRGYEIALETGAGIVTKRPVKALAFLADVALRQGRTKEDLRDAVRWHGTVPNASKGWERAALEAVRSEGAPPKHVRMVFCHYVRKWVPMGRARTRCPSCGAAVGVGGGGTHPVELMREGLA